MRARASRSVSPGVTTFIQASKVALDVGDKADWIRCERCTSVSPRNPLIGDNCGLSEELRS